MNHLLSSNSANFHLFAKMVASHTTINDGALQIDKSSVLSELLHNPLYVTHNSHSNASVNQIYQNKLPWHKKTIQHSKQESDSFAVYFLNGNTARNLLFANTKQTIISPFEFRPINDSDKKGFFLQLQHTLLKVDARYEFSGDDDDGLNPNAFDDLGGFNSDSANNHPFDLMPHCKQITSIELNMRFPNFLLSDSHYKAHGFKGILPFYKKDELTQDDFTKENIDAAQCLINFDLREHARFLRYANEPYSFVNSHQLVSNTNVSLIHDCHQNGSNNFSEYRNSHAVLHSIGLYEHKDTGRISLLINKRNYYTHRKTYELKTSPIMVDRLTYNPNDGSLTFKRNNRSVYGRALSKALNEAREILRVVNDYGLWNRQEMDTIMSLCSYGNYLLSRSPLKTLLKSNVSAECLKSLYSTGYESLDENLSLQRRRVLYHLKKGNTHKAIDSCLHNVYFPKKIRQALLDSSALLRKEQLNSISEAIDMIGVDNTYRLLFLRSENGQVHSDNPFFSLDYLRLVTLGFSAKKVINYKAKPFSYASDIIRMYDLLANDEFFNDVELKKPSHIKGVQDYHDYLSKLSQIQQQNRLEQYKAPHVSKFGTLIDEKNGFIVRPVKTTAELVGIGAQMNHCVGSYTDLHFRKGCEIIVITPIDDESKYLTCISLNLRAKDCCLEQAKLPCNVPAKENPELAKLTIDWLNAQKQTIDFKGNYDLY